MELIPEKEGFTIDKIRYRFGKWIIGDFDDRNFCVYDSTVKRPYVKYYSTLSQALAEVVKMEAKADTSEVEDFIQKMKAASEESVRIIKEAIDG